MSERTRLIGQEVDGIFELAKVCKAHDRLTPALFDRIINCLYPDSGEVMDKGLGFIEKIFQEAINTFIEEECDDSEEEVVGMPTEPAKDYCVPEDEPVLY